MSTYSFLDCKAAIAGPGGAFSIGSDAGISDEGITTEMKEEKNMQVIGAGGQVMNSLRASNAARITLRILKTSPVNAKLSALYNFQRLLTGAWGQNTISIADISRGDLIVATDVAFARQAPITYSKDANINEWLFDAVVDMQLGTGVPDRNV